MTTTPCSGVHIERRAFLELPALAALLHRSTGDDPAGALAFAAFTKHCETLVREHLAGGGEEVESLLLRLAEAGARLETGGVPRPSLGAFGGYDPKVAFGPIHRAPPVMLIEWRLDPLAWLPPHNHTPAYVVSLCLEGACRVEHFEIAGDAPVPGEEGEFQLRRTRAQLLRPGQATSLTPARDNVHTFRAGPKGALGVDINVVLPGEGDWSMIELAGGPEKGFEELHEARWIGQPK